MSDENQAEWLQLTLEATLHSTQQLEDALLAAGAMAVTLQDAADQPVFEPLPGETPLWSHTRVTGLFDALTDIDAVKEKICAFLGKDYESECCIEKLENRDWVRAWLDHFHPMRFGTRLWVCPTQQAPPEPSAINVFLDPGLAFGTGTHPSTALCLSWLDSAELANKTIIDYGCGSGILAIAAAKLGAGLGWAVDIDPQALLATGRNALANGVASRIAVVTPRALPALQADLLLANILAGALIKLAPRFAALVRENGQLVLAGILAQQSEEITTAFKPWFNFELSQQQEDWMLFQAVRQG